MLSLIRSSRPNPIPKCKTRAFADTFMLPFFFRFYNSLFSCLCTFALLAFDNSCPLTLNLNLNPTLHSQFTLTDHPDLTLSVFFQAYILIADLNLQLSYDNVVAAFNVLLSVPGSHYHHALLNSKTKCYCLHRCKNRGRA